MYINISIIIPVYNPPHNMFEKCIGSLLSQTGELGLEFIFVNDGSTDGWIAERLERLEQEDSRVVVITKENEGVSVARNIGMETAKGEYIAFVDSDDYMLDGGLEYMYRETSRHGAEIGLFGFTSDSHNVNNIEHWSDIVEKERKAALIKEIVAEYGETPFFNKGILICSPWAKLYHRDFLIGNNIKFIPGLSLHEDTLFVLEVVGKADRIVTDNKKVYIYECVNESLSKRVRRERLQMSRFVVENKKRLIEELGYNTEDIYEELSFFVFRYMITADLNYLCNTTLDIPLCQRHRDFCDSLDDDVIKANIKSLTIETLKRYSINSRNLFARLFIYKYKLVWILTAKTWIKQKIIRQ